MSNVKIPIAIIDIAFLKSDCDFIIIVHDSKENVMRQLNEMCKYTFSGLAAYVYLKFPASCKPISISWLL